MSIITKLGRLGQITSLVKIMSLPSTSSRILRSHTNQNLMKNVVRQFASANLTVLNDTKKKMFFVDVNGSRAYIKYLEDGDLITLISTNVPKAIEGQGIGKVLAKAAFEYVAENDLKMTISCEFLDHYLEKYSPEHKKYLSY